MGLLSDVCQDGRRRAFWPTTSLPPPAEIPVSDTKMMVRDRVLGAIEWIPPMPVRLRLQAAAMLWLGLMACSSGAWLAAVPAAEPAPETGLFDPLAGINAALGSPVRIEAKLEKNGTELAVTAVLEEGWHLYSVSQKPGGPKPTRIFVAADAPLVPGGPFLPDTPPHSRTVDDVPGWKGLVVEEHAGRVTWRAGLVKNQAAKGHAAGEAAAITGSVSLQLCRDNACTPPETIPFTVPLPTSGQTGEVSAIPAGKAMGFRLPRGHVDIQAEFAPQRPGVGGKLMRPLVVRLLPDEGWHLYAPASTGTSAVGQGRPTIVSFVSAEGIPAATLGVVESRPAADATLAAANAVDGPVTLEILLPADASPREAMLGFQACTDSSCDPPSGVRLAVAPPVDGVAGSISFFASRYAEAAKSPASIERPAALNADRPAEPQVGDTGGISPPAARALEAAGGGPPAGPLARATVSSGTVSSLSLPMALLSGLLGGLILNLMPCVLPVLGLKLMSFAQQSGRARQEVFQMNLWYCAGLYAVFFVLATASVAANIGLGGQNLAWGEQFTSTRFNIVLCGIVFAFALSFLGVWELPIPGFIGERAGQVQSQEGPLGAFLKGVLSTVLATPCSGPFLGPVFGFTLAQPTAVTYAVFGAIATGMALPYLLVGVFPGLVKFLPKPGAWMETFKEILGFVMLGTVVFLFTFLNHDYFVPTFALLVGIWAACWWVGKGQEAGGGTVGLGRWAQAAAVAAAIGGLGFTFLGPVESIIPWEPFSRSRLAELRSNGATVMVDFSADWCMTCKLNLAAAIETSRVKAAVESNRVVPLLADWTEESPEIKTMLESLQAKSIPVLAFFPAAQPGENDRPPIILRDLISEAQVLKALGEAGPSRTVQPELRARAAAAGSNRER